jgi:signal transduction histidine kinase/CheY-like chemotaxis protein/HPt (histidine-containing phosphotransfer) domain-containing protein
MVNKVVHFIQQSNLATFVLVQLLLGVVLTINNGFSVLILLAVLLSSLSVLSTLQFFKDRLNYDQMDHARNLPIVLSSIVWAICFWKNLEASPSSYIIAFTVLTTSSLLLFSSIRDKLLIILPLLVSFVGLLIVSIEPSQTLYAVVTVFVTLLFLLFNYKDTTTIIAPTKEKEVDSVPVEEGEKLDIVNEINILKSENIDLREDVKRNEIALSAAEMAKMEFLATMSHEIRTPLNGIIPLLDILLDSELTDFQKDYLSTAHLSAIQMQKLIDDLLDYSKVEAGKLNVELRGLKVSRILEAVKISFKQAAGKKRIRIETSTDSSVSPFLRGDPTRLRQVLSNLLSNAIKFSNSGTVKITAKKIKNYPTKEVIRFEVIDQGIGLDKETSDNIFLPFTQEDNSSTRKFGGTGLGLAISKKIIDLMEGTINVKSEKGKGSTFYFDLPLLKSMGETQVGSESEGGHQAILVNTNPALFNHIGEELSKNEIPFQKALGLPQAYEIYNSIKSSSKTTQDVLVFLDFETAGKQVRKICEDLSNDTSMENMFICIINNYSNIAGIPKLNNIKIIEKDESISKLITKIEVYQASLKSDVETTFDSEETTDSEDQEEESKVDFVFDAAKEEPAEELPPISIESDEDEEQEAKDEQKPKVAKAVPAVQKDIQNEVLLVEDNEVNLKVAEKLIHYIGDPFDVANNGQEALDKVKENRYRMFLMDCQMPIMDGDNATQNIRIYEEESGLNRTPILAMTANAMIGDKEKCFDAGMDDYMSKPLNRFILEKTLKKWDPFNKVSAPQVTPKETPEIKKIVPINPKWLSVKALNDVKEYMGEETFQLLEMFEQEAPVILRKIKSAITSNDFSRIKKKSHMLKSSSANVGANGLSYFARKMELASMGKNKTELIALFNNIKKAYLLTMKEINKYKENQ